MHIHGCTKHNWQSPEYRAYCAAKDRCRNPNSRYFKDYGGRGIQFRFASFQEFLAEIGPRPVSNEGRRSKYSLDRKNNEGHYEIGNVKWSTNIEQRHNRRRAKQPKQKLTWAIVEEIRKSTVPHIVLAGRFGVSDSTIIRVRNGVDWKPEEMQRLIAA